MTTPIDNELDELRKILQGLSDKSARHYDNTHIRTAQVSSHLSIINALITSKVTQAYYEGRCHENVLCRSILWDNGKTVEDKNEAMIKNYRQWKTGEGFKP